jgi:hypothetical protein
LIILGKLSLDEFFGGGGRGTLVLLPFSNFMLSTLAGASVPGMKACIERKSVFIR